MGKKVLSLTFLLSFFPLLAFAAFDRDLYFGLRGDPEVIKLQEFLRDQEVYSGPITGNFLALTLGGVKAFQKRENIEPAAGFFGPLSRVQANKLLESTGVKTKEEVIADITRQIAELQKQLQELQAKQPTEAEKPKESLPTAPAPVVETPVKPSKLIISGSATSTFPEVEMITFKMGEFSVDNNTSEDILVASFEGILSEEMDSARNRNREVLFLVRDGSDVLSTLQSTTKFTFILDAPKAGSPHKAVIKLPYDKLIKSKEKRTVSIWIEKMLYVKSGTLRLDSTKTLITSDAGVEGNFNLVLTREPPL